MFKALPLKLSPRSDCYHWKTLSVKSVAAETVAYVIVPLKPSSYESLPPKLRPSVETDTVETVAGETIVETVVVETVA